MLREILQKIALGRTQRPQKGALSAQLSAPMGSAEVAQLLRCEADVRLMLGKCLFAKGDWNRARATISEVASLLRQLPPGGSGITGAADVERYRE